MDNKKALGDIYIALGYYIFGVTKYYTNPYRKLHKKPSDIYMSCTYNICLSGLWIINIFEK